MYFIILFVLSWTWFIIKADKSRLREMYGAVIYTSFLGLLTDLMMVQYKLWSYSGLPHSKFTIPLILDFGIYPVVAYLFLQNLPLTKKGMIKRTLIWTLCTITLEFITVITGHIEYHLWWRLWLSLIADILIFTSIIGVYRFYSPAYKQQKLQKSS